MRWDKYKASLSTQDGNDVYLEYDSDYSPPTMFDPPEYEQKYKYLKVNDMEEYGHREIESLLDNILSDDELNQLFHNAKPDRSYP